jgi:cell cycle checkpoint protein
MENDLFITYLHQNCLGFFQDIESCAESMGYISEADTIRSKHDWQEAVASEYRNLISIHGIMRKPDVRTNYRFYSIQKPLFFDAQSTMQLQKRQNYQQALMQSVEARSIQYQSQEIQDNPMEDIEDFSDDNFEDEFDDIYGDGSDLAFLANNF